MPTSKVWYGSLTVEIELHGISFQDLQEKMYAYVKELNTMHDIKSYFMHIPEQ